VSTKDSVANVNLGGNAASRKKRGDQKMTSIAFEEWILFLGPAALSAPAGS
jgi:hypothetical protein